jgi:hypothetical protein
MKKNNSIKIYNRQIKYPIAGANPAKKTAHIVGKGTAIMIAEREITVSDEEKIFALLYLAQNGKAEIIPTKFDDRPVVKIKTKLYRIKKILKNHNYLNIIESFARLKGMTLIYDVVKKENGKIIKGKFITSPVIAIKAYEDEDFTVYIDEKYYHFCMEKPIYLNTEYFDIKSLHAKNVYKFLVANQNQKRISIATIAERCLFSTQPKKEQRRIVRESLEKINKTSLGRNAIYTLEKDHVVVKKIRKTKKTTYHNKN